MTNLATFADIKAVRPISNLVNSEARADMYLTEAQNFDVAQSIGIAMIADLITNPSTAPNALLLSGGTYTYNNTTYECLGLKKAIAYYAYSRILKNNPVNATAFGIVQKQSDFSDPSPVANIAAAVRDAEAAGRFVLQSCIDLIQRNPANYPLSTCIARPRTNTPRFKSIGN